MSGHPRRLFTRNQAITAMVLAERLAAGYGHDLTDLLHRISEHERTAATIQTSLTTAA